MAENENVVEINEPQPEPAAPKKPSKVAKFFGGIKERLRKSVVNLKRRPMNIAFVVLIVSTLVNLCYLGSYASTGIIVEYGNDYQGLCIFVVQLFSILVIMLFLNSFPKRSKKPKVVMLVLTFVFMAVMLGLDIYLRVIWHQNHIADTAFFNRPVEDRKMYYSAYLGVLVHAIMVGIAALLTATYPLYGKLINMINTRKVVESNDIKEEIDTEEDV